MKQTQTTPTLLTTATAAVLMLLIAGIASADTVTWNLELASNIWDTTTANWEGDDTTFEDNGVDDVVFRSDQSPQLAAEAVTIAPASVAPKSMLIQGRNGGSWTFSGGDITGSTSLTNRVDRLATFNGGDANGNYTFTGGTLIDGAKISYEPASDGGVTVHSFGAGDISLDTFVAGWGGVFRPYFNFVPGDSGDSLSNNFVVEAGGAEYRNTGQLDGAYIFKGDLIIPSGGGSTIPFMADMELTRDTSIVSGGRTITISSTNVGHDSSGPYSLTVEANGTNPDWRTDITSAGGTNWDIVNFTRASDGSNGTLRFTNGTPNSFFAGVAANGGTVIIEGGSTQLQTGTNTFDIAFPLLVTDSGSGYGTGLVHDSGSSMTINVNSGGLLGGDGTYQSRAGLGNRAFDNGCDFDCAL